MGTVADSPTALLRILRTAAIPVAAFLVFAVSVLARWGSRSAVLEIVNMARALGFPLLAAVSAGVAARRTRGQQRRAWLYMTLGLAAWTFGEMVVFYSRFWLGHLHPLLPSAANMAFLLFPVAACAAMVAFPAGYPEGVRFRMMLDGAIVAASLFVVSWVVVLRHAYAATGVKNPAAFGSLAYPVLEVIAVTVAGSVLARAHPRWRLTVILLTMGRALTCRGRLCLRVPVSP